jgi:hypothetical protein
VRGEILLSQRTLKIRKSASSLELTLGQGLIMDAVMDRWRVAALARRVELRVRE